jgi:hypothetical protein
MDRAKVMQWRKAERQRLMFRSAQNLRVQRNA